METEQLRDFIIGLIEEFKGVDVETLNVDEVCDFADYFIIVSGTSTRHVQSMAEELIFKCKHAGHAASSIEGLDAGEWVLLDFARVIVHLFLPEKREHYNLEELWQQANRMKSTAEYDVEVPLGPGSGDDRETEAEASTESSSVN